MNQVLATYLVEFLRREKPTMRELPIPTYVERLLAEIEAAGFSVRKKNNGFKPKPKDKDEYSRKVGKWRQEFQVQAWQEAFPNVDTLKELAKAGLWLKAAAESGKFKTRFDQFFHNWLSRAQKSAPVQPVKPTQDLNPRESLIANGLKELAASRSERLYPSELALRSAVAARDFLEIPTEFLEEVFRRGRLLDVKTTPSVYQLVECWKSLKNELQKKAKEAHRLEDARLEKLEDERWNLLTPLQKQQEIEKMRIEMANRKSST